MSAFPPRLRAMFAKTKPVCFGRFLVNVPESAEIAWGKSSVELGIEIYPDGAEDVDRAAARFADELRLEKSIHHERAPLLLSEEIMHHPSGRIITGYESFDSIAELKMRGYFRWDGDGFVVSARPLLENRGRALSKIRSIAKRLRPRAEDELPEDDGNCIEHGFLPDQVTKSEEPPSEHIRIGVRLKEFADTHLSIYIGPSNPHYSESDSIEWQLSRRESDQKAENPNHLMLKTRYLRRGPRQVSTWQNGWEALSVPPVQAAAHEIHDFILHVRGVPFDVLKPFADIRMQTGVADNLAGAVKPSLTDEEAVAVWDAITSTIRVRPTTTKASAQATPHKPLGERLVAGRTCPQTGWWQPTEPDAVRGLPRQRIEAGATMPMVTVAGKPSLWQKLKGEQPRDRIAAVWQLVAYEE